MKALPLVLGGLLMMQDGAGLAQTSAPLTTEQQTVVAGNNAFAVDLYAHLRKQEGNLFFSPESISTALAMTYAGARGETAAQMAKTLHFTLPQEKLHPAMGALLNDLNADHAGYKLRGADALWAEKSYNFADDFLKLADSNYGAGLHKVDFNGAPDNARGTINDWVAQKTEGKITDLLAAGTVKSDTRLVLTNAIYFKGDWQTQFAKSATTDGDFHLSAGQSVKTPLMHEQTRLAYLDGGRFQAVAIPYKSGELSMVVLLPKELDGLAAFERSFTEDNAQLWLGELGGGAKVMLTLPKFKMTREFGLADTLSAMGMALAFSTKAADFSGMTGKKDLSISAVVHKAFVAVDEEGTEAAAATAIGMRSMAMAVEHPPIVFRADHPFLFLIRDNRSGAILFMGRVTDPTK